MATTSWHVLSHDELENQIGQVDLMLAMYPDDLTIDGSSQEILDTLRRTLEDGSAPNLNAPPHVLMHLSLPLEDSENSLQLEIRVPFFSFGADEGQPRLQIRIQQPTWLNRTATAQLNAAVSEGTDDLLTTLQDIQESAAKALDDASTSKPIAETDASGALGKSLVRVWFYFPSISTRSKRDDFIINAPYYAITGFLCAGKPGLLCLEGDSQQIDEYMRFIKTESWGDIPAHHKKVSERYREPDIPKRVFEDMQEITDMVGERRGHRGNRGDMKVIEQWLVDRGVGDAFAKVLM
ncbi:hypothetical protein LIA77_06361 [Sarocladium implicatum]|nr:hypothetical protein LIA77_06361 [Sarocladium implicatum]